LLVGGNDPVVVDLNRKALDLLICPKELVIIPGATHLFEEPGMLDQVAVLAANWFTHHFEHDQVIHHSSVSVDPMEGVKA
jgi:hypothetical protein